MTLTGWVVLSADALMELLRRAWAGEDPDLLYAEFYANCSHEEPSDE